MMAIVYKSERQRDLYLYVSADDDLSRVPEALLEKFGEPVHALTFELDANRTLAREDPQKVLANLEAEGFHLQMPPPEGGW
jgi:uncharacterized protein